MSKKKTKAGRPPLDPSERRAEQNKVSMTTSQRTELEEAIELLPDPQPRLTQFIVEAALAHARHIKGEQDRFEAILDRIDKLGAKVDRLGQKIRRLEEQSEYHFQD